VDAVVRSKLEIAKERKMPAISRALFSVHVPVLQPIDWYTLFSNA